MRHYARRSIAGACIALCIANLTSCYRTRPEDPMQVLSRGRGQPSKVRVVAVTMRDGRFVPFDRGASAVVAYDSLSATVRGAPYSVPLSDIERVWIERLDRLTTTLVVVGVVALVYATVELIRFTEGVSETGFFRLVSSLDGRRYLFNAEPTGGTITPELESDDYSRFEHLWLNAHRLSNEATQSQHAVGYPAGTAGRSAGAFDGNSARSRLYLPLDTLRPFELHPPRPSVSSPLCAVGVSLRWACARVEARVPD